MEGTDGTMGDHGRTAEDGVRAGLRPFPAEPVGDGVVAAPDAVFAVAAEHDLHPVVLGFEPEAVDEELNRIVGIFKLAREQGYTLKLIPGTPEENAPVFDFENERILRPAA